MFEHPVCEPVQRVDRQIGKFRLQRELGRGSAATVYLATDTFCEHDIALKVFQPGSFDAGRDSAAAQFLKEASLAGRLSHPHIASIFEATMNPQQSYVAMEYVPGGDLSQFCRRDHLLPVDDTLQIGFKSCGALDYAHKQGVVHRDLKPANIMLVAGTNIKVADFGAALLRTAREADAVPVGSPAYVSPEQILGKDVGSASDQFSLGVVLYELLTGERPFKGDTVAQVLRQVACEEPRKPSELRSEVAVSLDDIVLRMLAKNPEDRYSSWAELALDIAKVGRMSVYERGIADSDKFTALRRVGILAGLDDAEIWELAHAGDWSRRPSRSTLVREDEPGETLFFLGAGQVKVTKNSRLLSVLSAGEYFGEMAYIKAGTLPRQATIEAITEVTIAEFQPAQVKHTSARCQLALTEALLHAMVDRLALANQRLATTA
ncbi:MAG TPA: serine/threonine-protein kinase [Burkholderiales bacterium]|nr:serine/threonine-protein kinase [Burkholderiales bacterium]